MDLVLARDTDYGGSELLKSVARTNVCICFALCVPVCVCVCMTNEAKDEARGGLRMLDAETQEGMTSACSSGFTASVLLPAHLHAIRYRIAGIANATIELNSHKRHPNAYITTHK